MIKYILFGTLFVLSLMSCTKIIDIKLKNSDTKIVVEGEVTDNVGPYYVSLSKTVAFSSDNNYPPVQNALVTISDNVGQLDTLEEFKPGYYRTKNLQGIPGRTYTLKILADGKSITAISSMPAKVPLDSVTFLNSNFGGNGPGNPKTLVPIPNFLDPATPGNFYRFITTLNDTIDNTVFIDNDNLVNGLKYQRPLFSRERDMFAGDSLLFEMQCIDKSTYDYFYSLNATIGQGPGGGTTPANPVTNVTGEGALGYFSAHTTESKNLLVE